MGRFRGEDMKDERGMSMAKNNGEMGHGRIREKG
jgi:hypothetical protein